MTGLTLNHSVVLTQGQQLGVLKALGLKPAVAKSYDSEIIRTEFVKKLKETPNLLDYFTVDTIKDPIIKEGLQGLAALYDIDISGLKGTTELNDVVKTAISNNNNIVQPGKQLANNPVLQSAQPLDSIDIESNHQVTEQPPAQNTGIFSTVRNIFSTPAKPSKPAAAEPPLNPAVTPEPITTTTVAATVNVEHKILENEYKELQSKHGSLKLKIRELESQLRAQDLLNKSVVQERDELKTTNTMLSTRTKDQSAELSSLTNTIKSLKSDAATKVQELNLLTLQLQSRASNAKADDIEKKYKQEILERDGTIRDLSAIKERLQTKVIQLEQSYKQSNAKPAPSNASVSSSSSSSIKSITSRSMKASSTASTSSTTSTHYHVTPALATFLWIKST